MRLLLLLLPLALMLCLPVPVLGKPPAECQSKEEAETVAALAREDIREPALALTGAGSSAAAQGGEWLVVGWRPCLDPMHEPEGGAATRITLYHRADKAKPRRVASIELPSDLLYVAPVEDPVVETPWGPLLLIEAATGGNCWTCEKLVPLRVAGDRLLPVEPADNRIGLKEVTSSAPDIIITGVLSTFESYGPFCHACSPATTVYMRLEKDRLVEACDQFRDNYRDDALAAKEELEAAAAGARTAQDAIDLYAGALARMLDRLNARETASVVLPDFLAMATRAATLGDPTGQVGILATARALSDRVTAAQAAGMLDRACPALGLSL